jgi:hypothetical protein
VSAKSTLEKGGWIKSPLSVIAGTMSTTAYTSIIGLFLYRLTLWREVQIFCPMCSSVGLQLMAFLGEAPHTAFPKSGFYPPALGPAKPARRMF